MTPQTASPTGTTGWTAGEGRARYRQDRDLFTAREHACLCFLRWLVQTGRLVP